MRVTEQNSRYLRLLGLDEVPRGIADLRALVRAHILRVPFENVSKLLLLDREGAGRPIAIEEFLDGLEFGDLGGTCYSCNPFLHLLLRELGYDADLLGCNMSNPNVHTAIRVRIDDVSYHVDVGYGSPFLEPVPVHAGHTFRMGEMKWRFEQQDDGRVRHRTYVGGREVHGYVANSEPRSYEFFRAIIADSFQPGSTFTTLLRMIRIFPDRMLELKDRTYKIHVAGGDTTTRTLNNMAELRRVVSEDHGLPRCPVEKAVEILERINGFEFFGERKESSPYT